MPSSLSPEHHALLMQALAVLRQRASEVQLEPQSIAGSAPIFRCVVDGETRWIPALPEITLCATLQEARRKVLAYDVQHPGSLLAGFGPRPREADLPPLDTPPARAQFETHEVMRVPVHILDEQARNVLFRTNQQTVLFPQALAEAFGAIAGVTRITISSVKLEQENIPCLRITAEATAPRSQRFWYLRLDELAQKSRNFEPIFQARFAAAELARLYLQWVNR